VGRPWPAMKQEQLDIGAISSPLGPYPESSFGGVDRDHSRTSAHDVIPAGVVEIAGDGSHVSASVRLGAARPEHRFSLCSLISAGPDQGPSTAIASAVPPTRRWLRRCSVEGTPLSKSSVHLCIGICTPVFEQPATRRRTAKRCWTDPGSGPAPWRRDTGGSAPRFLTGMRRPAPCDRRRLWSSTIDVSPQRTDRAYEARALSYLA